MQKHTLIRRIFAGILAAVLMALTLGVSVGARDVSDAEAKARVLKALGLFRGVSDTNFDLEREPTRAEALVILIRVLGKESEALAGGRTHPFTDVPAWADPYIAYAYQTGLTKGVSATEFGTGSANGAMMLTFMLRALGYSDTAGDFSWNDPFSLAKQAGILPDGVDTDHFWRADAVLVSYAALKATVKGAGITLAERLIAAGVFTAETYTAVIGTVLPQGGGSKKIFVADPADFPGIGMDDVAIGD